MHVFDNRKILIDIIIKNYFRFG